MDKIGYRKVKRHEPNFRQWLKARGEKDAGMDLFFQARVNVNVVYRQNNHVAVNPKIADKRKRQETFSKSVEQINAYHDAIERGDVEEIVEYEPLDMEDESDRAYLRVQRKRASRKLEVS